MRLSGRWYAALAFGMSFYIAIVSMWDAEVAWLSRSNNSQSGFEAAARNNMVANGTNLEPVCKERLARTFHGKYSPLFDAQAMSFFKNFTTRRCELAVVMAGAPRTGSTLLTKITLDCLKRLSEHLNVTYTHIGYWRSIRHTWGSPMADMDRMVKVLDNIQPDVQVLLLKSHEYDPEIFKLCQKTLVLTSTKDARQLMQSVVGAKWVQNDATSLSNFFSNVVLQNHRCWQRYAQLRFHYDSYASVKRITAISIMTKLAEMLNLSEETFIVSAGPLMSFPIEYMQEEANPGIPGGRGKDALLDFEEIPEFTI